MESAEWTAKQQFLAGLRAELPIAISVIPFGLIYGLLIRSHALSATLGQAMSFIIFAGASQFIATPLLASNTPIVLIWLTTLFVNLRHLLYSAALTPYTRHLSWGWKALLSYLLTDEAFVPTQLHYQRQGLQSQSHWFWLGAGLLLWGQWQLSTAAGLWLGGALPTHWGLDFTLSLTFMGMIVPSLKDRPMIATALSAGLVATLTYTLPYRLGLLLAALIGIIVGVALEPRPREKK